MNETTPLGATMQSCDGGDLFSANRSRSAQDRGIALLGDSRELLWREQRRARQPKQLRGGVYHMSPGGLICEQHARRIERATAIEVSEDAATTARIEWPKR